MKYKIGDIVSSPHFNGTATVIRTQYSTWSERYCYTIVFKGGLTSDVWEEGIELVPPPAQDYLDLFI